MTELKKEITLYGLTMVAIGSCIGSGIFRTPNLVAQDLPSPLLILMVWALGGVITLTGALTFGELGGMFPKAGGVYVYLKEAYGELFGFLFGWAYLTVICSGSIAALCVVFAEYLGELFPQCKGATLLVAGSALVIVTIINILRVKAAEVFASVFTTLKIAAMAGIIFIGLYWGKTEAVIESPDLGMSSGGLIAAFGAALIGVLWSYGGWQHATFIAGETKNAHIKVPVAIIIGTVVVTVIYLLANWAYLALLPIDEFAASEAVSADAISKVFTSGGKMIAVVIAVSVFGTAGIYTLSAPRLYYAMARDGLFFSKLAEVHPRFHTPVYAILVQSGWSIVLLLFWGTFEDLITYVVFMDWIFFGLAAFAVFIFRFKRKDAERPYKTLGYPVVPAIFVLIVTYFVINTLIGKPEQAWAGIILIAVALPIYYYFKKTKQTNHSTTEE